MYIWNNCIIVDLRKKFSIVPEIMETIYDESRTTVPGFLIKGEWNIEEGRMLSRSKFL